MLSITRVHTSENVSLAVIADEVWLGGACRAYIPTLFSKALHQHEVIVFRRRLQEIGRTVGEGNCRDFVTFNAAFWI